MTTYHVRHAERSRDKGSRETCSWEDETLDHLPNRLVSIRLTHYEWFSSLVLMTSLTGDYMASIPTLSLYCSTIRTANILLNKETLYSPTTLPHIIVMITWLHYKLTLTGSLLETIINLLTQSLTWSLKLWQDGWLEDLLINCLQWSLQCYSCCSSQSISKTLHKIINTKHIPCTATENISQSIYVNHIT